MAPLRDGDRVRIVTRSATADDLKSGLYYPHFGGLTGAIQHTYGDDEVGVEIEPESLTSEVRARHRKVRDQMKTKWLDGLSEEGRQRLTERERDFVLRYVVLVRPCDLEHIEAKAPPATAPETTPTSVADERRRTSDELERLEEEELRRRAEAPR